MIRSHSPLRIGPYEVKARLGRGGMGDVYLAQHEAKGSLVAIKRAREIDSVQLASLRREIYALSRLRHPGIVRLVDHGTTDSLPWCALEYVEGETLQAILEPPGMRPSGAAGVTPTTATMVTYDDTTPHGDGIPFLPRLGSAGATGAPPPEVVARCLSTVKKLCEPLAFLHGEGIVHCDLKPANVVLRPGGMPVIIDFGLMVHFSGPHGRERLDESWSAVGTFDYMAPERIRRELVDARADLYALGCMLYEILTGRPPFVGEPRQILRQHTALRPVAPSTLVPGVLPEMDELVLRLLEKDPRARIGYADSVAAALAALGIDAPESVTASEKTSSRDSSAGAISSSRDSSAGAISSSRDSSAGAISSSRDSSAGAISSSRDASTGAVSSSPSGRGRTSSALEMRVSPGARGYLYRPTFAGYTGALRRITVEPGGLVLIGAESGAGKTRFAMEVGRALAGEMRVVTGECLPLGTEGAAVLGAPLHPLAPLLRSIADECRSQGPGMTEMLLGRRGRVLADYEPSLLDLPEVRELSPPARLSPEAAQQRLYGDLAETFFAYALLQRLVLILDDLQWADELTIGFLRSLSPSSLADQGVLVVGTYRKDEAGEALRSLAAGQGVKHVELRPLDRAAVASIARDMLALPDPPAALVDHLFASSDGNPFFVAEYLRAAVEEGLLARDPRGNWVPGPTLGKGADLSKLPTPGSVRDLLETRLDALAPGARTWAFAASVVGREIDRDVLEKVARAKPGPASADAAPVTGRARLVMVEELLARQILEEMPRGFRFVHDMLREVAYERIPPARKKELHLATARALEEVHGERGQLAASYAALAHHYGAAEVDEKTFHYLEKAAESALASGAFGLAHAFLTRALSLDGARGRPAPALVRARWNRWLGEAAYAMGDLHGLGAHSAQGLAELGRPLPRSALGWGSALVRGLARQGAAFVSSRVAPAGAGSRREPAQGEREVHAETAQTAAQLAFRYYFGGNAAELITTSLLAVNEAEGASRGAPASAGTPRGLPRPYAYLGYLTGLARLHPVARAYFQQAVEAGRAAQDPDGVAFALMTEAAYRLGLCDWAAAERAAEEALAIQIANDNAMDAELIDTLLGHIEYFTGRIEASRRRFEALHAAASRRHNQQHRAWGLYATARCDLADGREAAPSSGALGPHASPSPGALRALPLLAAAEAILADLSDEASELIVDGLFAQAHLALGDLGAATLRADRLARRIDRFHVPTVFSTVHAYVALAEVRLFLWEQQRAGASIAALRACGLLEAFAALFPFARPAALRCQARARGLLGQRVEAVRGLARSAESAHRLGMPHEEVLARREMERLPSITR